MSVLAVDINLFCRDPAAVMAFYRDLFDLPENEFARGAIYRALRFGAVELGFNAVNAYALLDLSDRQPEDAKVVTAFATFVVDSEAEIDRLAARAGALGGRIVKAPYRTYYGAWQAVIADPEEHIFRINFRGGA